MRPNNIGHPKKGREQLAITA
jgi:hypothetical protein